MKAKIITSIITLSFVVGAYVTYKPGKNTIEYDQIEENFIKVDVQNIQQTIKSEGEIVAGNGFKINAPAEGLRKARIWNVEIQNLVPEGTRVNKGDFVASLDQSAIAKKIVNLEDELEDTKENLKQVKLDTSQELTQERNKLSNLKFNVEEQELVLEQSKFEPPATIKQNEIDLEKAKRSYKQAKESYQFKLKRAKNRVKQAEKKVQKTKEELDFLKYLSNKLTIKSPKQGIIIYAKNPEGQKIREGSNVSVWQPTVASIPEQSSLYSRAYVKEENLSEISPGEKVTVSLVAYPEISMEGTIEKIANLAEKTDNNGNKFYPVKINLSEVNEKVLPTMTTRNEIQLEERESVTAVPRSSLHKNDNNTYYLLKKSGNQAEWKQVEVNRIINGNAIIGAGINKGDTIHARIPEKLREQQIPGEDINLTKIP